VKPLLLIALWASLATAQSPVQPSNPVSFKITHVEASKPQIIRIYNLDEGTREIVLPPAAVLLSELADSRKSEKTRVVAGEPQTIVIFNLGEGTREIELSPVPK
jgi:hypothetical protein